MITLYLDMDGVLCNFNKAYHACIAYTSDTKRFSVAVLQYRIFEDLDFMTDTQELLNYVSTIDNICVEILTSVGTFDKSQGSAAKYQKQKWLDTHNIPYKVNFVRCKSEKAEYAHENSILVDDSIGCVKPFTEAGGFGILHENSTDTIQQIHESLRVIRGVNALRCISL